MKQRVCPCIWKNEYFSSITIFIICLRQYASFPASESILRNHGEMNYSAFFPPSNFTYWPISRVTALSFNGVLTIPILLSLILAKKITSRKSNLNASDVIYGCTYSLWGFWINGYDQLRITENQEILIEKKRLTPFCCCTKTTTVLFSRVDEVEMKFTRACDWPQTALTVLFSVFAGIWLHFWPCIFWTCDWGPYDGASFRGSILFLTPLVLIAILCPLQTKVSFHKISGIENGRETSIKIASVRKSVGKQTSFVDENSLRDMIEEAIKKR